MAIPNPPLVGVLDSAELSAGRHTSCLSPTEMDESCAISNRQRRAEWLAGRMAAKYVFLERQRCDASTDASDPRLRQISGNALQQFPSEAYREVIVARDKSPAGGAARIGWRSKPDRVNVAISHVQGFACAFIGNGGEYSVDLEAPSPRVPAFYAHNFTAHERSWTGDCARCFNLDPNWLYTLLWSVKECLLKTPAFAALSLWNMASIEINILAGADRLRAVHQATELSGNLAFLQAATLQDHCPAMNFRLAVGGTANLILTAITKFDEPMTGGVL